MKKLSKHRMVHTLHWAKVRLLVNRNKLNPLDCLSSFRSFKLQLVLMLFWKRKTEHEVLSYQLICLINIYNNHSDDHLLFSISIYVSSLDLENWAPGDFWRQIRPVQIGPLKKCGALYPRAQSASSNGNRFGKYPCQRMCQIQFEIRVPYFLIPQILDPMQGIPTKALCGSF